jgi:PIN domain nuclease of toxin-antitoxin system
LLLDTHLLIWAALTPQRLSLQTRELLEDTENELLFSVVSVWEVAIKFRARPLAFDVPPKELRRNLLANHYTELLITADHAIATAFLPALHKDPFDRLLLAQSAVEGFTLITSDRLLAQYPGPVRLV